MKKLFLLSLLVLLFPNVTTGAAVGEMHTFEFQALTGNQVSLDDYKDKPVLIEWAASWCSLCKSNQGNINSIYDEYKDDIYFFSIAYGGSGDDLGDVQRMRDVGNYPWTFGLDNTNYAETGDARNAHLWVLNTEQEITSIWKFAVVSTGQIKTALNEVISATTSSSETTNGTSNSAATSNTVTTTSTTDEQTIQTFNIFSNPIFIVFIALVLGGGLLLLFSKVRKS